MQQVAYDSYLKNGNPSEAGQATIAHALPPSADHRA